MNDVLKREINHAYIPQDVQVAIDTILSYAYELTLENTVLRRRLEDAKRLLDDREIDKEIAATHMDTVASESTRIRKIANETPCATEQKGENNGNNKDMRETMETVHRIASTAINDFDVFAGIERIRRISGAAISKPPRNCDAGTAEEQTERYNKFCRTNRTVEKCCTDCPASGAADCELAWAQMPYTTEGESNEQK